MRDTTKSLTRYDYTRITKNREPSYKILYQERHKINTMYHENAVLAWNGNPVEGIGNIKTFMMEKLPKSNTFLNSLDAQPVHDSAVQGKTTVLVVVITKH